jgi:hypothetical protein
VAPKFGPEILGLPANTADPSGPIEFSPDGGRIYWFQQYSTQQAYGELWTTRLPPVGDGKPKLVGSRVAAYDISFFGEQMMWIRDVDAYGVAGELVASAFDGSNVQVMAEGVTLGGLRSANPTPVMAPAKGAKFGPIDLGVYIPPPVFANLTSATRDLQHTPINLTKSVLGALSFGSTIGGPEGVLNSSVKLGNYTISDDSYVLAYAGNAKWDDNAMDFVGELGFFGTLPNVTVAAPALDGINQLGPIIDRAMFVSAPANANPGIYFIKF